MFLKTTGRIFRMEPFAKLSFGELSTDKKSSIVEQFNEAKESLAVTEKFLKTCEHVLSVNEIDQYNLKNHLKCLRYRFNQIPQGIRKINRREKRELSWFYNLGKSFGC